MAERQPSSPLCQNCLATELYCDANLYIDGVPCCGQCEHVRLKANVGAE